jgi:hypothetical protein
MTSLPTDEFMGALPWPKPVAPRAHVTRAIMQRCTHDLQPASSVSGGQRALLSLSFSAAALLLFWLMSHRANGSSTAMDAALLGALGWGLVQSFVLLLGLARPPGRRGSQWLRWSIALAVPALFFGYLGYAASHTLPLSEFVHGHAHRAAVCGLHAVLAGALLSAGVLAAWRRTDPITPGLSGALAGLVGGLSAAAALGVACPNNEAWHLWTAHGTTVVILVVAGWLAGKRWLSP